MKNSEKKELTKIIIQGALLVFFSVLFWVLEKFFHVNFSNILPYIVRLVIYIAIYSILGFDIIKRAITGIAHGEVLDENFLMCVASIGAFFIEEYFEGVSVITLYALGEMFQDMAVGKSRDRIKTLIKQKPKIAHVDRNGEVFDESPENVKIGDIILVKPGENIPLDGTIADGIGDINMASLTGESVPQSVSVNDNVFAGTISTNSLLKIRVTKLFSDSSQEKIIELVENSSLRKSKIEKFITKFATIYTPAVVISAFLLAVIPSIITGDVASWVKRALSFLVISCPCALVISIPLAFFASVGKSSKQGILVKGSDYLEKLSKIETIVFDKTGTITRGEFSVNSIGLAEGSSEEELLTFGFIVENSSNHPISKAVCKYCEEKIKFTHYNTQNVEELPGLGISCELDGNKIYAGNEKLLTKITQNSSFGEVSGTIVYIIKNDKPLGYFSLVDKIKEEARDTMNSLRALSVKRFVMLSGDRKSACEKAALDAGISEVKCELRPEEKLSALEQIIGETEGATAYVGDGINDAPALALSDVGIAMGEIGQDAAIEAADVVILKDDLRKIPELVKLAKRTILISKENIIMALSIKLAILALSIFGISSLPLAVFADVGVLVLAILNSMRLSK